MKYLSPILHGLALAVINITAILFGFGVYTAVRPANQIAVQAPVAALASLAAALAWAWLSARITRGRFSLASAPLTVFFCSLAWLPLIFLPLHGLTQGYLSSFGNILAGWAFQAPVNALALWLARAPRFHPAAL